MEIRTIDRELAVAPQLQPADLAALAGSGFRAVICNRPDGEARGPAGLRRDRAGRPRARNGGPVPAGGIRQGER